jgi:hypothetical protein
MTDYSDIVRILYEPWNIQAACAIESQARRIKKLEKALKPFAYYAEQIPDDVSATASASGTVGDLRYAREVLGEEWGEK